MTSLTIAGRKIGPGHEPYVIAEMSANHNGDIQAAMRIISQAKEAGVSAVKMQTYRPDTITLPSDKPDFRIEGGLWDGRTLYELYDWAHTPWEWHEPLFDHARDIGVTLFSSPFDRSAVDLLEKLDAPAYKIASFEMIDLPLIRYVASTGKPMIISTGMASADEIAEAIETARGAGCTQLAILHCVSGYPAPASQYNLRRITQLRHRFGEVTGLSDHTLDNTTAIASIAMGASIVEKHFTLDRDGGGPDDCFSIEAAEMAALCRDSKTAWMALGSGEFERQNSEEENVRFRRSLYFVRQMRAGDIITEDCVRSVRPGFGLPPKYLDVVIGRVMKSDAAMHTPVCPEQVGLPVQMQR